MRAAFKAVLDRKQVAVLVPTTLLAQQHFQTFSERFKGYPVTSSRSRASARRGARGARSAYARARRRHHRHPPAARRRRGLPRPRPRHHRRGAEASASSRRRSCAPATHGRRAHADRDPDPAHAEHVALEGMRDLSVIATPPQDRRRSAPSSPFDEGLVQDAITARAATRRAGVLRPQPRRVHRGTGEDWFCRRWCPRRASPSPTGRWARPAREVMLDFVRSATSGARRPAIIESGLDIPHANTIIINQRRPLRARAALPAARARRPQQGARIRLPAGAGRPRITADAVRRLEVLQAFTELGAGFRHRPRTTSRSAAPATCSARSSRAASRRSGFELYQQMVEEAMAELRRARARARPRARDPLAGRGVPARGVRARRAPAPGALQALLAGASSDELADLRASWSTASATLPGEVDTLHEVMMLKIDLRELAAAVARRWAGPAGGDAGRPRRASMGHGWRCWCRRRRARIADARPEAHRQGRARPAGVRGCRVGLKQAAG
jgi:transcription-repair coupling factor (superfamily II helicase)